MDVGFPTTAAATAAATSAAPGAVAAAPGAGVAAPGHSPHWRIDVPVRESYMLDADGVERELHLLARAHPQLARVVDVGDSARKVRGDAGHDITALVLGARPDDPSAPRILVTAGVHPRETANAPALLEWAKRTLAAAASGDPARRALLAERTVVVVPLVNPDAADTVIAGLDGRDEDRIWWRGNDGEHGAVDLNRNFDNHWGSGSADPASHYYRGPHAASEPEVRAIQELARAVQPAAVYDIHSPGEVVLAPAGTPDARAAAQLVADATGYAVSSSDEHWAKPVGGSTVKDWAHDRLGAVSLTIETGTVHHQNSIQYADTLARLLPALDALVATVDGTREPPRAARELATPAGPPSGPPPARSGRPGPSRA